MVTTQDLQDISSILRRDSLISTTAAGSGHLTSSLSCAEIFSCLFFSQMSENDSFILSKGHASPIYYSVLKHLGIIKEPLENLRLLKSKLEGHPIPSSIPEVRFATGSLGQGFSLAVGTALGFKLKNKHQKVYVLLGDSELAEGSNYEAMQLAAYYRLNNLIAIVDVNRLGQRGETMPGHNLSIYKKRFESFGFQVLECNGHNIEKLTFCLNKARDSTKPSVVLAKTIKGKGLSFLEDKNGWHGKSLDKAEMEKALLEIPNPKFPKIKIPRFNFLADKKEKIKFPSEVLDKELSTREAYGKALSSLAKSNKTILALDAEVSNSTFADEVKIIKPSQFIECFIAEQNLVSMALALSKLGFSVYASTFSAFLSRAHDQLRMAAISNPDLTFCGSHCGVSIGEDGASQMGLEDISMFRSLPGSIIFYPSDAISSQKLTFLASQIPGLKYIRTTRPKTPLIYNSSESFKLGDFKVLKESQNDKAVLIGAGITLHESLKAYEILKRENKNVAVIDLYCLQPLDSKKLIKFIKSHGSKVIISEDHYKAGGIGEMLISELSNEKIDIKHLYINEIPHSGKSSELLEKYQIDSKAIVKSVKSLV